MLIKLVALKSIDVEFQNNLLWEDTAIVIDQIQEN